VGASYLFFLGGFTGLKTLSIPEPWGATLEFPPYGRYSVDASGRLQPVSDFWRSAKCAVCHGVAAITGLKVDEAAAKIAAAIARVPTPTPILTAAPSPTLASSPTPAPSPAAAPSPTPTP
jgi:hypothetical protein